MHSPGTDCTGIRRQELGGPDACCNPRNIAALLDCIA